MECPDIESRRLILDSIADKITLAINSRPEMELESPVNILRGFCFIIDTSIHNYDIFIRIMNELVERKAKFDISEFDVWTNPNESAIIIGYMYKTSRYERIYIKLDEVEEDFAEYQKKLLTEEN